MNRIIEEDIQTILADKSIPWERFRNMSVLITGASGMLPVYMAYTVLFLNKYHGYNTHLYALVRNRERAMERFAEWIDDANFTLIVQDVSQPIELDAPVHFIIHAASQASPKYYSIDPVGTINANVLGTINTLNLAKEKKAEGYLYFSSGDVYGIVDEKNFPFSEDKYGYIDLLNVRSCYGESKRMGEQLCVAYNHQYKVPTRIARIFHTYGPLMRADDGRVFADFCYNIVRGEDIHLKSTGEAKRLFCYVTDATRAFLKILFDGSDADAYNVVNPQGLISIRELAEGLVQLYPEKNLKVVVDIDEQRNKIILQSPIKCAIPSFEKLHAMGWTPEVSILDGFKRVISSLTDA